MFKELTPSCKEMPSDFFQNLHLKTIYEGYDKKHFLPLSRGNYERLKRSESDWDVNLREQLIRTGTETVSSLTSFDHGIYQPTAYLGSFEHLANWVPHFLERKLIHRFAQSLVDDGKRPLVFDVGCGTGLLADLLAVEGKLDTIGVDRNDLAIRSLPITSVNTRLVQGNIWDYLPQFQPVYEPERRKEIDDHLQKIKEVIYDKAVFISSDYGILQMLPDEDVEDLSSLICHLENVVNMPQQESPIDLVICSFMDPEADLSTPIRLGIYPKCIVYVRTVFDKSGGGDYYLLSRKCSDSDRKILRQLPIGYNPGGNFKTVARWNSPSETDWNPFMSNFRNRCDGAEVIIQLREDVELKRREEISVDIFPFDCELEEQMRKVDGWGAFLDGVYSADHTFPA